MTRFNRRAQIILFVGALSPWAEPRRRSWKTSAAPVKAGSVPAGASAPSGAWSPEVCSGSHGDHEPPRRRVYCWLPTV